MSNQMPEKRENEAAYEAPEFRDYGDLRELTAAFNTFGFEDGGPKAPVSSFHHTTPP